MPNGAAGPVELHVQSDDLKKLYAAAKAAPGTLQIELRRGMREAGTASVLAVKRAASWSSRIPGAVRAQPFFTAKRAGVRIIVDAKKAPEGRPLEHGGKQGNFRHPVFGSPHRTRQQWAWVNQPAHPFFYAAIERNVEVEIAMRAVMARVANDLGL